MCSLGIEPTIFCAAITMLYHWITGYTIIQDYIIVHLWRVGRGREPWERSTVSESLSAGWGPSGSVSENRYTFTFSSLPSLFSVSLHPSISFSLASSVLTLRNASAPPRGGGSRAQSREYPGPARGDFVFGYFIIKVLNVRRFPPPSSQSTNCVTTL